ncbi:MAG TPA: hypothetical protein VFS91_04210 [Nitrobacter sp.]|nr:hypothetical protein [Nitrobacter sp.]
MTLAEFRNHLLAHLGVIGVGAAASAEDAVFTETVIANAQDELVQLGVALWVTSDIPSWAVEGFTLYCAPMAAPRFGKADEYPPLMMVAAIRKLRELGQDRNTSVGTACYF